VWPSSNDLGQVVHTHARARVSVTKQCTPATTCGLHLTQSVVCGGWRSRQMNNSFRRRDRILTSVCGVGGRGTDELTSVRLVDGRAVSVEQRTVKWFSIC